VDKKAMKNSKEIIKQQLHGNNKRQHDISSKEISGKTRQNEPTTSFVRIVVSNVVSFKKKG